MVKYNVYVKATVTDLVALVDLRSTIQTRLNTMETATNLMSMDLKTTKTSYELLAIANTLVSATNLKTDALTKLDVMKLATTCTAYTVEVTERPTMNDVTKYP